MIEQRNIAVCIILSIMTCGIYGIYWFIRLTDETNEVSSRVGEINGVGAFLLSLITFSIFDLYWAYRQGKKLNIAKSDYGIPTDDNSHIVYLLLCLFGLQIAACALMQNELNKIAYYT